MKKRRKKRSGLKRFLFGSLFLLCLVGIFFFGREILGLKDTTGEPEAGTKLASNQRETSGCFGLIEEETAVDELGEKVVTPKPDTGNGLVTSAPPGVTKPADMGGVTNPPRATVVPDGIDEVKDFRPHCIEQTKPKKYISSTAVNVDGSTLKSIKKYKNDKTISFDGGSSYTKVQGVVSFRGNNFRDNPTFGLANMEKFSLKEMWSCKTGTLKSEGRTWTGSGWTGQPLVMKWSKEAKKNMNMFQWAKDKDDLVEVIYACMDGKIHFLDIVTGQATRDAINVGYTFKGSGALDPRGYPILYVGAGYQSEKGLARVFVINLLTGKIMYTFGNNDPFSMRGRLSYFDSSPLVDAETDTLIYPGENGVLYMMRLGTSYDEKNGRLSINPSHIVKWHYNGKRTTAKKFWLGMEDSAVIYKGYLYIMDNGGNFLCLNLNTMKLVWVQDCLDDSNGTPVMSIEDGKAYLYASTSFHLGWRSNKVCEVPIWKIDAQTGQIIWKISYNCNSAEGVSGGVQSTIAVGKKNISDYIYVTVSKTGSQYAGKMVCVNKKTGKVEWEHLSSYSWSSPVCVYNRDGTGKVIYCASDGIMYLLDGKTGKLHKKLSLSAGNIEASPVVYNNLAVVGTRACEIKCVKLQ